MTEQKIIDRLKPLGYMYKITSDKMIVLYLIPKITNYICNFCNVDVIPDGLREVAIDMVCGEFLYTKLHSGQLDDIEVDNIVKSIKEGDTQITYAVSDTMSTFYSLIDYLMNGHKSQLIKYRRFIW